MNTTLAEDQHRASHGQKIKTGRGYILLVGILQLIVAGGIGVLLFAAENKTPEFVAQLTGMCVAVGIAGILFIGLWMWAKRNPFPAALTAFIVYLTLCVADAVVSKSASGIFIKFVILLALAKSVQSAYAVRKLDQDGSFAR